MSGVDDQLHRAGVDSVALSLPEDPDLLDKYPSLTASFTRADWLRGSTALWLRERHVKHMAVMYLLLACGAIFNAFQPWWPAPAYVFVPLVGAAAICVRMSLAKMTELREIRFGLSIFRRHWETACGLARQGSVRERPMQVVGSREVVTREFKISLYGVIALLGAVGLVVFASRWATLGAGTTLLACVGMACALYVGVGGIRRVLGTNDDGAARRAGHDDEMGANS